MPWTDLNGENLHTGPDRVTSHPLWLTYFIKNDYKIFINKNWCDDRYNFFLSKTLLKTVCILTYAMLCEKCSFLD